MARHVSALVGADGSRYRSPGKGTLGGHRRSKIFGRLDCPSALRAIARGGYVSQRVFFLDAPATGRVPSACLTRIGSGGQSGRRLGTTPATAMSDSTQSRIESSSGRNVIGTAARMRSLRS